MEMPQRRPIGYVPAPTLLFCFATLAGAVVLFVAGKGVTVYIGGSLLLGISIGAFASRRRAIAPPLPPTPPDAEGGRQ